MRRKESLEQCLPGFRGGHSPSAHISTQFTTNQVFLSLMLTHLAAYQDQQLLILIVCRETSSICLTTCPLPLWVKQQSRNGQIKIKFSQKYNNVLTGWPVTVSEEFKPYQSRIKELSTQNGCILWGSRVVIPPTGWSAVLWELYEMHPGSTKMKALARSYLSWPKMDLEKLKLLLGSVQYVKKVDHLHH